MQAKLVNPEYVASELMAAVDGLAQAKSSVSQVFKYAAGEAYDDALRAIRAIDEAAEAVAGVNAAAIAEMEGK